MPYAGPAPALPWLAPLRTVYSWQHLFFLVYFLFTGMGGHWTTLGFFVAMIWLLARERMRWLWNLPVNRSALLPLFVVPQFAFIAAGYRIGFLLGRHPRPVPEARVVLLELAAMFFMLMLVVFFCALHDWRRLRLIPAGARLWVLAVLISVPTVAEFALPGNGPVESAVARLWPSLPGNPLIVLALVLTILTALYAATDKVFREAEYADKPRAKVWGNEVWPGT